MTRTWRYDELAQLRAQLAAALQDKKAAERRADKAEKRLRQMELRAQRDAAYADLRATFVAAKQQPATSVAPTA